MGCNTLTQPEIGEAGKRFTYYSTPTGLPDTASGVPILEISGLRPHEVVKIRQVNRLGMSVAWDHSSRGETQD